MADGLHPIAATTVAPVEPQAVVEALLAALASADLATADALLDERVEYCNVGLPTIRGRARAMKALALLDRPGVSFEVYLHAISAAGSVVLTERTDVVQIGRLRLQFWVAGRFDVRDGRITLWRDAFDFLDTTRALARGLLGAVLPPLRPKAPVSAYTRPGRH